MLKTIQRYIENNRLLNPSDQVLVGLSGGADSVALLAILTKLGYSCVALHCNFHLRAEESDRDEAFSRDLADRLAVPFYSTHFDTNGYAEKTHQSIEMAARELRYTWFEEKRKQLGADAIAVAHHQDDSIETLLVNLTRGTGIRGLTGIHPRNGFIVRPLLATNRESILQWLDKEGYSYITDSTNQMDIYRRNFIRLRLLPLMEEINPSVRQTLTRSIEHLTDVEALYLDSIEKARKQLLSAEGHIPIKELLAFPAPATILYESLKPFGFNRAVSQEVYEALTGISGKIFYSNTHQLVKDRDYLIFSPLKQIEHPSCYAINTEDDFNNLPVKLICEKKKYAKDLIIEKNKETASFDYQKLRFPLTLRRWQKGDWFIPFGMQGKKKISDYFSDRKFNINQKEEAWLLCSGEDIIWLVGERTDDRYRIKETTKEVLIIKKVR